MQGLTDFYRDLCDLCQQLFELSLCDLSTELATIALTEPESWSDNPNCWWYRVDCVSHQTQKSITERASTASKSQSPKWPKTQRVMQQLQTIVRTDVVHCLAKAPLWTHMGLQDVPVVVASLNPFTQRWGMTLACATEGISMLWICMPNEPTLGELQQTSTESTKLWPCCPFHHQRRPFEYQDKSK